MAAHPDDECLGAGAFIADAADLGLAVTVLVLTLGERSHPASPTVGPDAMAARRTVEAERAAAVLAPHARVVRAGLPDGDVAAHHDEIAALVRDLTDEATLVLAPWVDDGHPDHDAAGRAAAAAVQSGAGAGLAHYLVWFWHWSGPDDLPWSRAVAVNASLSGIDRAAGALAEHHSQVTPLSREPGDERLLTDGVLAPARRGFTTLLLADGTAPMEARASGERRISQRADDFNAMFEVSEDPWSSATWYERRKRDLALAVLARERYGRVLDVGCSTGALTKALAERADDVVAVDASASALDIARRDSPESITWVCDQVPNAVDSVSGRFDLVVLSEVLYFLTPMELWLTLGAVLGRLAPGGELLLVDWRHPTERIPLDGPTAHRLVRQVCERWLAVRHVETDVLIDLYVVAP